MEQARRSAAAFADGLTPRLRARLDDAAQISRLEKVLHVAFPSREPVGGAVEPSPRPSGRDFSAAVELVRDAAEMIRAAEARAHEAEQRMEDLVQRATEELKSAEARVQAADQRVRAAELRSEEAEQRLREAEEWLARIFDVISEELPNRPA